MWKDEKCVFVSFFENLELSRGAHEIYDSEEMPIPEELITTTPEEIATELIHYIKKEYEDEDTIWMHRVMPEFLLSKNIDVRMLPNEIQLKLEKVEKIVEKQIRDEQQTKMKEELEQQKNQLPSLISQCIDWAKEQGLSRITKSDVEAFLIDRNIELLPQIQRSLYSMANVKMKSKQH